MTIYCIECILLSEEDTETQNRKKEATMKNLKCECGKGYVVFLSDGTKCCTNTIKRYKSVYGELPKNILLKFAKTGLDKQHKQL